MAFKFKVGDFVRYKPIGLALSLFKVVRRMPEEFQAIDWNYRIKSDHEGFERTVMQCDLRPSLVPDEESEPVQPLRRAGRHH